MYVSWNEDKNKWQKTAVYISVQCTALMSWTATKHQHQQPLRGLMWLHHLTTAHQLQPLQTAGPSSSSSRCGWAARRQIQIILTSQKWDMLDQCNSWKSCMSVLSSKANPPCPFVHLELSESGLLHRHHWGEAQTGLLLCGISRLVLAQCKTERHNEPLGSVNDYLA